MPFNRFSLFDRMDDFCLFFAFSLRLRMASGTDLHAWKPGKPLSLEIDVTVLAGKPYLFGV
jgi:hypothetical protein